MMHVHADERLISRADGAEIAALRRLPASARRGGVVVLQEIFGLTDHIVVMCETFAAAGYEALAPAMFDRIEQSFHANHDGPGIEKGRAAVAATPWAQAMGDVQAAIDALSPPVFVAGFCYGGALAWGAASRCQGLAAAACFYGRLIVSHLDAVPVIPTMLHYGARDASIPSADIARVRAAAPGAIIHIYENAGHGFCRRASPDYDEAAQALALDRTLEFFATAH